ncbi:MAG: MmcQ/YjbR family DNA-binding protein [Saprospiraceae bacterium]
MDIEALQEYCNSKKGVSAEFPFDESTMVFKIMGKIFALVGLESDPASVNLKCDPELAQELRDKHPDAISPGFHMSKVHWNTILLDSFSGKEIKVWVDHSYDLVVKGLPKALRLEWESL